MFSLQPCRIVALEGVSNFSFICAGCKLFQQSLELSVQHSVPYTCCTFWKVCMRHQQLPRIDECGPRMWPNLSDSDFQLLLPSSDCWLLMQVHETGDYWIAEVSWDVSAIHFQNGFVDGCTSHPLYFSGGRDMIILYFLAQFSIVNGSLVPS